MDYTQSYSSHYAQAYQQQQQPIASASQSQSPAPLPPSSSQSSWFQPGHVRCTYKTCSFTGSAKTVETHMMDRHLIYPPGYQKAHDWDADPILKGKPVPIQGTTLVLDSPEVLEAWINERKKRWPSAARVEEKKRKMQEAVARGQLSAQDLGLFANKRQRTNDREQQSRPARGRGRGRGRGQVDSGWKGRGRGGYTAVASAQVTDSVSSSSESENDTPQTLTSKLQQETPLQPELIPLRPPPKRHPPPPKTLPASGLLRNLLLPEIRMTVSNLSQAIHFLVENDFLVNVELKPGQASEELIQVVDDTT